MKKALIDYGRCYMFVVKQATKGALFVIGVLAIMAFVFWLMLEAQDHTLARYAILYPR